VLLSTAAARLESLDGVPLAGRTADSTHWTLFAIGGTWPHTKHRVACTQSEGPVRLRERINVVSRRLRRTTYAPSPRYAAICSPRQAYLHMMAGQACGMAPATDRGTLYQVSRPPPSASSLSSSLCSSFCVAILPRRYTWSFASSDIFHQP
jgi:hypothetical protein